jgi:hypothetical protein
MICPRCNPCNGTDEDNCALSGDQKRCEFLRRLKEAKDINVKYFARDIDINIQQWQGASCNVIISYI